jgi:hypothetical protein
MNALVRINLRKGISRCKGGLNGLSDKRPWYAASEIRVGDKSYLDPRRAPPNKGITQLVVVEEGPSVPGK